jgi:hypothetical protein
MPQPANTLYYDDNIDVRRSGHDRAAKALKVLHDFLGGSDMLVYLGAMAIRPISRTLDRHREDCLG